MREKFLQQEWSRYPTAHQATLSVALFYKNYFAKSDKNYILPNYHVAGQLQFKSSSLLAEGKFQLSGQAKTISFELDEPKIIAKWSNILIAGDTIAICFSSPPQPTVDALQIYIKSIASIELLSPSLEKPKPLRAIQLTPNRAQLWQDFLKTIRGFFAEYAFVEVATPSLVECPGFDSNIESIATLTRYGGQTKSLYLPTSPEIHLKKLLCAGWTEVFEIQKSFRNNEVTPIHEPEFYMLEWYRAYAQLSAIQGDIVELLHRLDQDGFVKGSLGIEKRTSMRQLFSEQNLLELTPTTTAQELRNCLQEQGLHFTEKDSFNDLFQRLFIDRVEATLSPQNLNFIYDFPPSQAALARLSAQGWAHRFEFYWRGLEIANAYDELNDPIANERRFEEQCSECHRSGLTLPPRDHSFFAALKAGMPPASGVALGVERLFMACQNLTSISELRAFSHTKK